MKTIHMIKEPNKESALPSPLHSGTKAGVKDNIDVVSSIVKQHKARDLEFAKDAKEAKLLWSARKEVLWSCLALKEEGLEIWSTDAAVPLSRLANIIEISKKDSLNIILDTVITFPISPQN